MAELIAIARQWGMERVAWLVFSLAEELLGAEVPGYLNAHLVSENVPMGLTVQTRTQLKAGEGQSVQMTPDLATTVGRKESGGAIESVAQQGVHHPAGSIGKAL